jgi:SAM-dependent methyltransferase
MFEGRDVIELTRCLCCDANLQTIRPFAVLDSLWHHSAKLSECPLGQPLANSYSKTQEEAQWKLPVFPLRVKHCPHCDHVQLTHAVDPDLMFAHYDYVSGTSMTMRKHFSWFANYATEVFEMYAGMRAQTVLDIGCNDGSQLDAFIDMAETYGVDPAENLVPLARKKGHDVYCGYFNDGFARFSIPSSYDILVAQNVFAHNPDPLGFLQTAKQVMNPTSVLLIQTSQADMVLNGEFDTIYHEHMNFFCIKSMWELVNRAGMDLVDVVKCPLHGNSYIFTVRLLDEEVGLTRPAHIDNLIDLEERAGIGKPATYQAFDRKTTEIRKGLMHDFISKSRDYHVVGYGCAAKGMTVLNYVQVAPEFIIDDSPFKQGKFTPGLGIEIVSSDEGFARLDDSSKPALFVILAWNFYDEIREKIKRRRNVKDDLFLTYFPEIKVTK